MIYLYSRASDNSAVAHVPCRVRCLSLQVQNDFASLREQREQRAKISLPFMCAGKMGRRSFLGGKTWKLIVVGIKTYRTLHESFVSELAGLFDGHFDVCPANFPSFTQRQFHILIYIRVN